MEYLYNVHGIPFNTSPSLTRCGQSTESQASKDFGARAGFWVTGTFRLGYRRIYSQGFYDLRMRVLGAVLLFADDGRVRKVGQFAQQTITFAHPKVGILPLTFVDLY